MSKQFSKKTYLGQVRELRQAANTVLKQYPIKVNELEFINHGENATFLVKTAKSKFLLRIHRNDYHSRKGIEEELRWLDRLSQKNIVAVQKPVKSRKGHLLTPVDLSGEEPRLCDVLTWQDGDFIGKRLGPKHFYRVGELLGKLQKSTLSLKVRHRNYWDTEGLLGKNAILGSLDNLQDIGAKRFDKIKMYRAASKKYLKQLEKREPDRMGMIHADLHFGNMVWRKGQCLPIDFDDCGWGFHLYDLAIVLCSARGVFERRLKKQAEVCREQLFLGYSQHMPFSQKDIKKIEMFMVTRSLIMLAWLYDRRDNPRLYEYFKKNLNERMRFLAKEFKPFL